MSKPINPLVSVVIPVYNGERTICRAIDSILNQTYPNFEILVVNDASIDNTKSVLNSLKDPHIKVINLDRNIGRSAARNLAINKSKGEYIAMLDADDYSYPDRLKEQITYMDNQNVVLCGTWAYLVDLSGNKREWRQPTTTKEIRKNILHSNTFIHSTVMARKYVIQEFGGYDKNFKMAEDYDLYIKITGKYPVGNVPIILGEYTVSSGIKYVLKEQWYKVKAKWKAIFNYGFSKKNIVYLFSPLVAMFLPKRLKIRIKNLYIYREKMRKKIFHVIESGGLSGSGRMVANICNKLDSSKFDITVLYATRTPFTPQEFESLFNENIHKINIPEMVRSLNPKKDLYALLKLYKLFKKEKPDIVHGHSSKGGFLARFAALFAGVPRIFYSSHGYSFRMTDVSIVMRIVYFILEAIASPIGYIVVNAPNELKIATRLSWRRRVLPYYNGIDIAGYIPKYPEYTHSPIIAACGRITAAKNPSAFVRLCSKIEKQYPNATFFWIGDGNIEESEKFQRLVNQLEVKNLIITGWLEPSHMREEMSKTDIFIHYSSWDVLPTVIFEAMALGKPVVGSKTVDQIIHGENGFIAKTEEELFTYTSRLLDSWELRNKMGKKARNTIEKNYSLDKLIKKLEKAYLT